MYTLFVLDYDGTYSLEKDESYGVESVVYLIKSEEQYEVEQAARKAHDNFHEDEDGMFAIGDCFKQILEAEGLFSQEVGSLHIPFGERQEDYLEDYIPRVIV